MDRTDFYSFFALSQLQALLAASGTVRSFRHCVQLQACGASPRDSGRSTICEKKDLNLH